MKIIIQRIGLLQHVTQWCISVISEEIFVYMSKLVYLISETVFRPFCIIILNINNLIIIFV